MSLDTEEETVQAVLINEHATNLKETIQHQLIRLRSHEARIEVLQAENAKKTSQLEQSTKDHLSKIESLRAEHETEISELQRSNEGYLSKIKLQENQMETLNTDVAAQVKDRDAIG